MDHSASSERDAEFDLETGFRVIDDNPDQDSVLNSTQSPEIHRNTQNSNRVSVENLEAVTKKKNIEGVEKIDSAEKKRTSNKKHPKPPRPPRSPSLESADPHLIREIAELIMLKRARIERRKAIKKMKAGKGSSSTSGNLLLLAFTVIFFFVVIFQGTSPSSTASSFQGSPVPAGPGEAGLILNYPNPYASIPGRPDSGSANLIEQVAGSEPSEKPRRNVG